MNKKVWLIVKEEDWFHDSKYTDIDVFNDIESAQQFFEVYKDIILNELRERYEYHEDAYTFEECVEINETKDKDERYISMHMEDDYYIEVYIMEKDVMTYRG